MKQTTTSSRYSAIAMVLLAAMLFSLPASAGNGDGNKNRTTEEIEVVSPSQSQSQQSSLLDMKNQPKLKVNGFTFRTNLLHWAAMTPNFGVGFKFKAGIEAIVDADYAPWKFDGGAKGYQLWNVQPQVRYYFTDRWYSGVEGHIGQLLWKLDTDGHHGDYYGGGVVAGYRLPIGKKGNFDLDFNIGLGYTHYKYDKYQDAEGHFIAIEKDLLKHNYGITSAGITLIYKW